MTKNGTLETTRLQGIQTSLLSWFQDNGRTFPWRKTRDPYKVLIAEKPLQQTSVRQDLVKAYEEMLATYPSPSELAEAKIDTIRGIIHALGLHYRAQELLTLAQKVCKNHNGEIPNDFESLMALPGIGDYTSRAILCFAFGREVPIVDTNVACILHRLFGLSEPIPANPARKRSLIEMADSLLPPGKARDFNFALLDLGAMVCKSANPECQVCPLLTFCEHGSSVIKGN